MSGAAWACGLLLVWLLSVCLLLTSSKVRRLERTLRRRPPAVVPMPRQESTDKLPISLALFGAWTRPANGCTVEQLEAVRQEIRRVHPDLATALDRAVAASRTTAAAQGAAAPAELPGQREQHGQIRRAECAAGRHLWRGVPGMDLEECTRGGCPEIRTVA